MREKGQLAFNAWWHGRIKPEWSQEPRRARADWARVEAAVLEEAAKAVERRAVEIGRQECCGQGISYIDRQECCSEPIYTISDRDAAAAILALKGEYNG